MKKLAGLLAASILASGPHGVPVSAEAPLRIVALGDSTTAGTPFYRSPREEPPDGRGDPEAPYTHWAGQGHPGWQILNKGIAGQRTDEIRARFRKDVVEGKPGYAVILAGVNDITQGHPLKDIQRDLLWMYQQAKAEGIVPIAGTVLPFDTANEVQARKIRGLNRWIVQEASAQGIPVCDFNAAARDPKNPNRLAASPDGLHPDPGGYRRMGEALAKLLEELQASGGVTLRLQLTSPAFVHRSPIPRKYTCDGENVSPAVLWTAPPEGTKSFTLVMEDPDAPRGNWVHWVVYNIPAGVRGLPEGVPPKESLAAAGVQAPTDSGTPDYGGPCPPSGTHRYFFRLYALDAFLTLPPGAVRADIARTMEGHVLEEAGLMGTYTRKKEEPPDAPRSP